MKVGEGKKGKIFAIDCTFIHSYEYNGYSSVRRNCYSWIFTHRLTAYRAR